MYLLGDQFNNTYTVKPGETRYRAVREKLDLNSAVVQIEKRHAEQQGERFKDYEYVTEQITTPDTITDYNTTEYPQGMLFSPEHYTQTRFDPTINNYREEVEKLFSYKDITRQDKNDFLDAINESSLSLGQLKSPENLLHGTVIKRTRRGDSLAGYRPLSPELRQAVPNELYINTDEPLSSHAVVHEIGHRAHHSANVANNRSLASWNDIKSREKYLPISEGVADAFGDRHGSRTIGTSRGSDIPETRAQKLAAVGDSRNLDYRTHTQARVSELEKQEGIGYGIDSELWDNNIDHALYGLTRLHVGLHGEKVLESLPNIDHLTWEYNYTIDTPNNYGKVTQRMAKYLAIGKLVHENPELETVFDETRHSHLGETVSRAKSAYATHLENLSVVNESYTPEQKQKHAVFAPYKAATPGQLNHVRMIPEVVANQEKLPGIIESMPKRKVKSIKIDANDKPESKPKRKAAPSNGLGKFFTV